MKHAALAGTFRWGRDRARLCPGTLHLARGRCLPDAGGSSAQHVACAWQVQSSPFVPPLPGPAWAQTWPGGVEGGGGGAQGAAGSLPVRVMPSRGSIPLAQTALTHSLCLSLQGPAFSSWGPEPQVSQCQGGGVQPLLYCAEEGPRPRDTIMCPRCMGRGFLQEAPFGLRVKVLRDLHPDHTWRTTHSKGFHSLRNST